MLHASTAVSKSAPAQFFPPYFGLGLVQLLFRVLRRDPPSHDLLQSLQSDQSPEGFHPPSTGFFPQLYSPRPFSIHHSSAEHFLTAGMVTNLKVPLIKSHLCEFLHSPLGKTSLTASFDAVPSIVRLQEPHLS